MGVAGTFMAGIARIAKAMGHTVTGSDQGEIYPPMSTQLEQDGIKAYAGYNASNLKKRPDLVIVGNAIKRGMEELEAVLNQQIPYISAPQWLYENVLYSRHVIALAGTHGKTTVTTMVTSILRDNGIDTGYLIGGVPLNLPGSAELGTDPFFVIEADEYDSAFFDKRSKFVHYRPRTLVINNIEFDHADIFDSIKDIEKQFHHCVRAVPSEGLIVRKHDDSLIDEVLAMGAWSSISSFDINQGDWQAIDVNTDGSVFTVLHQGEKQGEINWALTGEHNVCNALAAIAASNNAGIPAEKAIASLNKFVAPKRRMEVLVQRDGITIYDDFAHHPTAFVKTLGGLRGKVGDARIIVLLEMRSYTMRSGVHGDNVMQSLKDADEVMLLKPEELQDHDIMQLEKSHRHCQVLPNAEAIFTQVQKTAKPGDHIVVMSNGGFQGLQQKLVQGF
jgi:UDP-N-acetylmuramate: L-alanyl-gamma-D-glutamyl-meso-diaminopimelate ligase